MLNREVTEARVRSILNEIPRSAYAGNSRMRDTLKKTFSGMKTLLRQIPQRKKLTIIREKQQQARRLRVAGTVAGALVLILILLSLVYVIV